MGDFQSLKTLAEQTPTRIIVLPTKRNGQNIWDNTIMSVYYGRDYFEKLRSIGALR